MPCAKTYQISCDQAQSELIIITIGSVCFLLIKASENKIKACEKIFLVFKVQSSIISTETFPVKEKFFQNNLNENFSKIKILIKIFSNNVLNGIPENFTDDS